MSSRVISFIILLAFLFVTGVSAVHVHSAEYGAAAAIEHTHAEGAADGCTLCKVVKERAIIVDEFVPFVSVYSTCSHAPVVAHLVSDRCPLQQAGRAPPRR